MCIVRELMVNRLDEVIYFRDVEVDMLGQSRAGQS